MEIENLTDNDIYITIDEFTVFEAQEVGKHQNFASKGVGNSFMIEEKKTYYARIKCYSLNRDLANQMEHQ